MPLRDLVLPDRLSLPERPARVVSARRPSYVFGVRAVNPPPPKFRPIHSLRATISTHPGACPDLDKDETHPLGGCQTFVTKKLSAREVREVADDPGDGAEGAIEVLALVGRHQARSQQRAAGRDG